MDEPIVRTSFAIAIHARLAMSYVSIQHEIGYERKRESFGSPIQKPITASAEAMHGNREYIFFHVTIPETAESARNTTSQTGEFAHFLLLLTKTSSRMMAMTDME